MTLKHSQQIFEKYSNMKLSENPPVGAELFRAVGHGKKREGHSRLSQFCEDAQNKEFLHTLFAGLLFCLQ
jgi:hypothetical protein